jgi:hypothetical protein
MDKKLIPVEVLCVKKNIDKKRYEMLCVKKNIY